MVFTKLIIVIGFLVCPFIGLAEVRSALEEPSILKEPPIPQDEVEVTARPLESRAEHMRDERVREEKKTEERVREKIEEDRLKSEEDRRQKLIDRFNDRDKDSSAKQENKPQEVQTFVIQPPAPAVEEGTTQSAADQEVTLLQTNVGVGVSNYIDTINVRGAYALSLDLGISFPSEDTVYLGQLSGSQFVFNIGGLFSSYDMEKISGLGGVGPGYMTYPQVVELRETSVSVGLKYYLLNGRVRPSIGAMGMYTQRIYKDDTIFLDKYDNTSHAFDIGLTTGLDIALSKAIGIGAELRYIFNLSYRTNDKFRRVIYDYNSPYGSSPIESIDRYSFLIRTAFRF